MLGQTFEYKFEQNNEKFKDKFWKRKCFKWVRKFLTNINGKVFLGNLERIWRNTFEILEKLEFKKKFGKICEEILKKWMKF